MTTAEKIELLLIPIVAAVVWQLAFLLPSKMNLANILLYSSVLLLVQGLLRDIWLLIQSRSNSGEKKEAQCMCLESIVGMTGVVAGILLLGFTSSQQITITALGYATIVFLVTVVGFLMKDLVLQWNPIAIKKEKDHMNVIVKWK